MSKPAMRKSPSSSASPTLDDVMAEQERLALALEVSGIGLWDWDVASGEVQWSDEHFRMEGYEPGEVVPSFEAWIDRVHADDRPAALAALATARDEGVPFHLEFRTSHPDGSIRWLLGRGRFFYDADGCAERMIGALVDVTDRKQAVERQRTLVAELQHRVRNMLSVVRYVFARTIENSPTVEEAALHFRGRLDALARTQVAVSQSGRGLVDLEGMIRDELLSVGVGDGENVALSGSELTIEPATAETLGLVLHELTMNSVKFGALRKQGKLEIHWKVNMVKGTPGELILSWRETQVPIVSVVGQRDGFGKELIGDALPYRWGATTRFELLPGGLTCELSIPLDKPDRGENLYGRAV